MLLQPLSGHDGRPRYYAHTHKVVSHDAQMRSPTIRKEIDTTQVVVYPLAGRKHAKKTEQNSTVSNAESISSRSSPDHRRIPYVRLKCQGSTSPQLGHVCGLSEGLLAGWLLCGEGGRAGDGEGKEGGRLDDKIVI